MNKENPEELIEKLEAGAAPVIKMLKDVFSTEQGVDIRMALLFASGLAGMACHEAVKAMNGDFTYVSTGDGRRFYYGEALNAYLLEDVLSVFSLCDALCDLPQEETEALLTKIDSHIGGPELKVWDTYELEDVYRQIKNCWIGIFENITKRFCEDPSQWPVLYGIVLQNIVHASMQVGPKENIALEARGCAAILARLDEDSFAGKQ